MNELEPELLKLVDEGKIGMTPAVEISYLTPDEQRLLIETIDSEQATPSFSQAQRMRRLSGEGKLNDRYHVGVEKAGELEPDAPYGENPQILPTLLHTAEDGGNLTQTT